MMLLLRFLGCPLNPTPHYTHVSSRQLFKKPLEWGGMSLPGKFICWIIFCCEIPDYIVLLLVLMNAKRIHHAWESQSRIKILLKLTEINTQGHKMSLSNAIQSLVFHWCLVFVFLTLYFTEKLYQGSMWRMKINYIGRKIRLEAIFRANVALQQVHLYSKLL